MSCPIENRTMLGIRTIGIQLLRLSLRDPRYNLIVKDIYLSSSRDVRVCREEASRSLENGSLWDATFCQMPLSTYFGHVNSRFVCREGIQVEDVRRDSAAFRRRPVNFDRAGRPQRAPWERGSILVVQHALSGPHGGRWYARNFL